MPLFHMIISARLRDDRSEDMLLGIRCPIERPPSLFGRPTQASEKSYTEYNAGRNFHGRLAFSSTGVHWSLAITPSCTLTRKKTQAMLFMSVIDPILWVPNSHNRTGETIACAPIQQYGFQVVPIERILGISSYSISADCQASSARQSYQVLARPCHGRS